MDNTGFLRLSCLVREGLTDSLLEEKYIDKDLEKPSDRPAYPNFDDAPFFILTTVLACCGLTD